MHSVLPRPWLHLALLSLGDSYRCASSYVRFPDAGQTLSCYSLQYVFLFSSVLGREDVVAGGCSAYSVEITLNTQRSWPVFVNTMCATKLSLRLTGSPGLIEPSELLMYASRIGCLYNLSTANHTMLSCCAGLMELFGLQAALTKQNCFFALQLRFFLKGERGTITATESR